MRVLVTGGAGFIGSHIADAMLAGGHEVGIIDSGVAGVDFAPADAHRASNDLCDMGAPDITGWPELIVHCAAYADVSANWDAGKGVSERDRLLCDNVIGTSRLLESCRGVPIIFLSTCAVYGDNIGAASEAFACEATSPYAASKLAGEALIQAYAFEAKSPWHVLRLGCVVGSRYHHGHVADFVRMGQHALSAGTPEAKIRPRNDGLTKKSFVHVADVCQAVTLMSQGGVASGVYNCVSGVWSPRDTIYTMGAQSYTEWPENTHGWVGDPMAVASNFKLRGAGWVPQRSIEDGVREALTSLGW